MPIPTWIRDALGIRKDFVETKKSLLEIAKLENEKREREFLIRASTEDIEKYDPNTRFLLKKIAEDRLERYYRREVTYVIHDEGVNAAHNIVKRLSKPGPKPKT